MLTTLHNFSSTSLSPPYINSDGSSPFDGLCLGKDGNFYGTTVSGGSTGNGTIFKISPTGALTSLHSFSTLNSSRQNADGLLIYVGLSQGNDGNFYGVASQGGTYDLGTAFKMTPDGTVTTLINFNVSNGYFPRSRLVAGSDGNFYSTTSLGGDGRSGTVYRMDGPPAGTPAYASTIGTSPVPLLLAFTDPSGIGIDSVAFPTAPAHGAVTAGAITESGTSGTVGVTYTPAAGFIGTDSFTYTVAGYTGTSAPQTVTVNVQSPVPVISSFAPASGPVGTGVILTGMGFTGATSVKFNGTSASFSVTSDTQITTTVPAGATTGPITVSNVSGTATGATFTVTTPVPSTPASRLAQVRSERS